MNTYWLIGALATWWVYAAYVVFRIHRSGEYEPSQLRNQIILACLVPIAGALVVHLMFRALGTQAKADHRHIHLKTEESDPSDSTLNMRDAS